MSDDFCDQERNRKILEQLPRIANSICTTNEKMDNVSEKLNNIGLKINSLDISFGVLNRELKTINENLTKILGKLGEKK